MSRSKSVGCRMVSMAKQLDAVDVSKLPIMEERLCPNKDFFDQTPRPLMPGSIICRPMTVLNSKRLVVEDVKFKVAKDPTGRDVFVLKAYQSGSYFTDNWIVQDHDRKGLVCLCNKHIPEDWAAFEVTSMAPNGRTAWVKPIAGGKDRIQEFYKLDKVHFPKHAGVVDRSEV